MQYNFFNLGVTEKHKITKPIRLIELFGGIGSQAKALTNLGMDFEHYRLVEFDKYAIQSYNAVHNTNFIAQDIKQTSASDLGIVETDKYEYIVTYSFPCTDLSLAGKREGMAKGSGTRSGLLWEVERILTECEQLPQILLMENVPQVLNSDFGGWLEFLESLGYHNYYDTLNAKDFGIPQNRERIFMVSLLGDYYYEFPKPEKLELRLRDMLESNVDENYYLSDKALNGLQNTKFNCSRLESRTEKNGIIPTLCARDYKDPKLVVVDKLDGFESSGSVYSHNGLASLINTMGGGNREPKIAETICLNSKVNGKQPSVQDRIYDTSGVSTAITTGFMPSIAEPNLKTKLCNKLIEENRVKEFDVIRHSYSNSRLEDKREIAENNNISPTLDTRCDCLGVVVSEQFLRTKNKRLKSMLNKIDVSKTQAIDMYNQTVSDEMNTITTRVDASNCTAISQNYRIRKLTPKECWRLMGFSDTDFDKAKASGVSNSQLYKQAGNSIVVNVLMAIFRQLGGVKC